MSSTARLLWYQEQVVAGLLRCNSCLAVLGRGLGVQSIVLELARRALEDGGTDGRHAAKLVFLLNTPQEEVELLAQRAAEEPGWASLRERFVSIGPENSVEDRAKAFSEGGVFALSAQLLVPDLLVGRVLPEAIDGIVLNHAHSVGELSAEAFVIQIFRGKNKRGFVHAVTDKPDILGRDQSHVEKLMQRCFIQHLEVWPRIRQEVQKCLQASSQPDVCQKTLPIPESMQQIQRHVLNIIDGTLEELKKDPNLSQDIAHIVTRDSLFRSFDTELRRALDPSWQRLGPRTRRMVQDLKGIRNLLSVLLRCDAVEFQGHLESLCASEGERDAPVWLLSPDAQALRALAKARVYEVKGGQLRRTLEPHAKWGVLLEVIDRTVHEVAERTASEAAEMARMAERLALERDSFEQDAPGQFEPVQCNASEDSDLEIVTVKPVKRPRWSKEVAQNISEVAAGTVLEPRILVVVPDEKAKRQVSSVLHRGPQATLLDAMALYLKDHSGQPVPRFHGAGQAGRGPRPGEGVLLAREAQAVARDLEALSPQSVLQLRRLPDGRACHPRVDLVAAEAPQGSLEQRLAEVRPHCVVLVEPALEAIRALEVYCALEAQKSQGQPSVKLEPSSQGSGAIALDEEEAQQQPANSSTSQTKAYLLVFEESVEKYRFQQALVQESSAMDSLIRSRFFLTVRLDDKAVTPAMAAAEALQTTSASSRKGGGSRAALEKMVQQKVVVDMREFRSALPFMLYLRGLNVDPITIPVGDYILSRDICVERKAIPDLVQSLNSGRLYQQAQNMCQHYGNPSLLIEFDPAKSFALQNTYFIAQREVDVGAKDLLGKLSLLVLHFPKLRLIWSPSQRFSADLFTRLKQGRYQPDPAAAANVDAVNFAEDDAGDGAPRRQLRMNSVAFDVLRKLPGVTPKTTFALARRAGSLAGVAQMSEEELSGILGAAGARQCRQFLDAEVSSHLERAEERTEGTEGAAAAEA